MAPISERITVDSETRRRSKVVKREVSNKMKKKPKMNVGLTGPASTMDGKYHLNVGSTPKQYNKPHKKFMTRKSAVAYKNRLLKQLRKNKKYTVDYIYMAN